jgi:phosphoribosylglycinamide formyltransferase-1
MSVFVKKNIAVFASGRGSNALKIIEKQSEFSYNVALLICNNKNAAAIEMAENDGVKTLVLDRNEFYNTENILLILEENNIDFLVLAGFMWLVPEYLTKAFVGKIVNIHPSLLPKYGGKGMYGKHVHEAVFRNKELESGITIHEVNAEYDKGKILLQHKVQLLPTDTPETIANKVLQLEHNYFASTINDWIEGKFDENSYETN